MCQTKDAPIREWVALAVARARETGAPAVFWLDETRAHDAEVLRKVRPALERARHRRPADRDPRRRRRRRGFTLERARNGQDTISVTGNVLRDYLTDLFPILELGTSAKMLSIVPLMRGGGPVRDRRRRLGAQARPAVPAREPPALGLARRVPGARAVVRAARPTRTTTRAPRLLADTLDRATGRVLEENRSPSRQVGELDNRGSHFYLALYWAQELAEQTEDEELAERFAPLARAARRRTSRQIVDELDAVQGSPVDIGGYYRPDADKVAAAMRPSADAERGAGTVLEREVV